MSDVLREVAAERAAQDARWGEQNHPDGTGGRDRKSMSEMHRQFCMDAFHLAKGTWRHILAEEFTEALAESDPAKLRAELIQVAAVAVAWIEAIDRRERTTALEQARPYSVAADLGEAVDGD